MDSPFSVWQKTIGQVSRMYPPTAAQGVVSNSPSGGRANHENSRINENDPQEFIEMSQESNIFSSNHGAKG